MIRPQRWIAGIFCSAVLLGCGLSAPRTQGTPIPEPSATETQPSATVLPTATPQSTETPVPTATAEPPRVLFREHFEDDTTCFRLHTFEQGINLGIDAGEYRVRVEEDTVINLNCQGGYRDFVMDFDVNFSEFNTQSLIGLSFRIFVGTSYNLYLTGSGEYCWDYVDFNEDLYRILAGCWQPLPDEIDLSDTVTVRIVASAENMAVLLDGVPLAVAVDPLNDYGSFGFFVAHEGDGATEVVIDNILIREIAESDLAIFRSGQTG